MALDLLTAAFGQDVRQLPSRRLRWIVGGLFTGLALLILGGIALLVWWNNR